MQRLRYLLLCALLALLIPAAALVFRRLPADTHSQVAGKYAGWNGVLQGWVCCSWECAGSITGWLNRSAAAFERAHPGVYLEFTPVSVQTLRGMDASGMRPPEMIFFSPDVHCGSALAELPVPDSLRGDLSPAGRALPVAMGGYIWVYNRALAAGPRADAAQCLPDDPARSFSAALAALSGGSESAEPAPEPGIDLGLPASAAGTPDALQRFMNGELTCMPVSQAELARLIRLRGTRRGPDWDCAPGGSYAWNDQLLMAAVPARAEAAPAALAAEFIVGLLADGPQDALAEIGAFSVTGRCIHGALSPWRALDELINSRPLRVPGGI